MSAWIYQDPHQVNKVGATKASWYVGWIDPSGRRKCKSCGPGSWGLKLAGKKKRKVEAELMEGTYETKTKKTWDDLEAEYDEKVLVGLAPRSRDEALTALAHFQRIIKPVRVCGISTEDIDEFTATRRQESGKKRGDKISPYTVNKELRHVRAALQKACDWRWLSKMPLVAFEREPKHLPRYITGQHFALIYEACDGAKFPADQPYPAADWWRAVLVMGYMTGWRISDMLGFRRADLDLEAGYAITRARDNKGKRDERVKLHSVVVDHLRKLASFDPQVFPWHHDRTKFLWNEYARIQEAAGVHLACDGQHEHTRFCHVYGFHDLRRAFATLNANQLSAEALRVLMRHKSFETTRRYINMAEQMDEAVAALHVPTVLAAGGAK